MGLEESPINSSTNTGNPIHSRAKLSNPSNSGLCKMTFAMDSRIKREESFVLSALSRPMNPWRNPIIMTTRSAKKL